MGVRDALEFTALVVGLPAAGAGSVLGIRRISRRLHDLSTAIMGEPARTAAGLDLPRIPSIGERFAEVTAEQAAQRAELAALRGEFSNNGGGTLRDRVDQAVTEAARAAAGTEQIAAGLAAHAALSADQAHGRCTA